MYAVSPAFKSAIKDTAIPKSCLVLFADLFFSSSDFTDNGVVFNQFFNTSEDLTFGDCPSDTVSFSVVSNGNLAGYGFGKAQAFLGVEIGKEQYTFGDIYAHIEVGLFTFTASDTGLYRAVGANPAVKIDNGIYHSLISDGWTTYAIGTNAAVSVDNATGTVSAYTPNRFMAQKLQTPLSAVFMLHGASNLYHGWVWDGENMSHYEYVPMGEYNVVKPRSTVGDVVTVQDAYDNMVLFDKDASEFLGGLTYPITLGGIYTALCDFVGVSYASSTFDYSATSYSSSPFSDTSCTLRDILWWIAERARKVAHFNRIGQLELMDIGSDPVESLTASDIGQDGYSIAEYLTPAVTGVLLKGTNGSSLTFGTLDTPYVISANPFISTISNSDLNAYWAIPRYVPFECEVLEADPSIDVGDMINIRPAVEDISALTDVYGQIYASLVALTKPGTDTAFTKGTTVLAKIEAYAIEPPTYSIPLMERELRIVGGIRAKYVATGNEEREADISDTEYNANVAFNQSRDYADSQTDALDESFNQQKVFNRLTNNGQAQGIFIDPATGQLYINGTYIQAHTVAVNKLVGIIRDTGQTWSIDFDTGEMTIGNLSASNITAGTITANVEAKNLSMTGGSINIQTDESLVDQIKLAYDVVMSSLRMYGYASLGNTQLEFTKNTVAGGVTTSFRSVLSGSALDMYMGNQYSVSLGFDSNGAKIVFSPAPTQFITIQPTIVASW